MKRIVILLFLSFISIAQTAYLGNADLSDLDNIKRLKINLAQGYIHIVAWDKKEVQIQAFEKKGFIEDEKISFNLLNSGTVMHLDQIDPNKFASYNINVPYDMDLELTIHGKGQIRVRKSKAEIVANTTSANIRLNELGGSAIVNSQKGSIYIDFTELNDIQSFAFSNSYGSINLALPLETKATFQISSVSGDVYSDFELHIPSEKNDKSETIESDFLPLNNGRIVGKLNGGGVSIPIHTLLGDIYIEKRIVKTKGTNHANKN